MATWEGKPTLASVLKNYIPPTESALADPIKEHFATLPQQLATNQAALDKAMGGWNKTDFATGQPNPNYYPEAIAELTQIMPNMAGTVAKLGPAALTRKALLSKEIENLSPNAINIGGKEIPVTMHLIEAKEGNQLVNVNTNTFDKAFKNTEWQYVGKNAEGGKPERIAGVEKYLESGKPMNASNAIVKDNGSIVFGDGRHRYAVLRDMGLGKVPMSMDAKSIENARKFGYID
jgi:hypothetical protein